MLKEIFHFAYHAPGTLALKRKLSQAELYDTLALRSEQGEMKKWRSSLLEDVSGDVLEIGCGTGLMFRYYPSNVSLSAVELDWEFLDLAKARALRSKASIHLCLTDGQGLPFQSHSFDCVVIVMVLCSVPSVVKVLEEVKRVLKPKGAVRLIEHVRSHRRVSGKVMDILNPLWLKLNGQGCNLNRNIELILEQNGFNLEQVKSFKTFTPGMPTFPKRWIRASLREPSMLS